MFFFLIVEELKDGCTLHLLQKEDQALAVATEERITFTPHHDTLVNGGDYHELDDLKPLCKCLNNQSGIPEVE